MTDHTAQLPSRISTIRSRAREHEQDLEAAGYGRRGLPRSPRPLRCALLYFIRNPALALIKIGVTDDVDARRVELERACGVPLEVARVIANAWMLERDLHKAFASTRALGEWFHESPELLAIIDGTLDAEEYCWSLERRRWTQPRA